MSATALERAQAANGLGRYDDGAREARTAIAQAPTDPDGYGLLAQALLGKDDFEGCMAAARDGLRHAPDSEWLHRTLAIGLRSSQRLDEALAEADEAVRLAPDTALAHKTRGDILQELKRTAEARAAYEKAIELDPESPRGHAALGDLFLDDDPVTAEKHFRRALELDPNHAANLNNFGVALMKQGRTHEAAVAFKTAVLVDPTMATAKRNVHSAVSNLLGDAAKGFGVLAVVVIGARVFRAGRHIERATSAPQGNTQAIVMAVVAVVAVLVTGLVLLHRWKQRRAALANLDPQLKAMFERVAADKKAKRL